MFYDAAWNKILSSSPFSTLAKVSVESGTYEIGGIFYSGTYGVASEAKYQRDHSVKKQSFQIALNALPAEINRRELANAVLVVFEKSYRVSKLYGGDSGVLNLELAENGN